MLRLNDCNDYLVNMFVNDVIIIYWMPVCRSGCTRRRFAACSCKSRPTAISGYSVNDYDFVTYFTNINKIIEKDCVDVMLNCLP